MHISLCFKDNEFICCFNICFKTLKKHNFLKHFVCVSSELQKHLFFCFDYIYLVPTTVSQICILQSTCAVLSFLVVNFIKVQLNLNLSFELD